MTNSLLFFVSNLFADIALWLHYHNVIFVICHMAM